MTLFWRQRARRFIAQELGEQESYRIYGQLTAALQDLERLQVMRPNDPVIDMDHADCLLELAFPQLHASAETRSSQVAQALELLTVAERQLSDPKYAPLAENLYLITAKAHALSWVINQSEDSRARARGYLDRARRVKVDPVFDRLYQRIQALVE